MSRLLYSSACVSTSAAHADSYICDLCSRNMPSDTLDFALNVLGELVKTNCTGRSYFTHIWSLFAESFKRGI